MRLPERSSRLRVLLPIAAALALLSAGCAQFESPPSRKAVACDPRLVGEWYTGQWVQQGAQEPKRIDEDTKWLSIKPGTCALAERSGGRRPADVRGYSLNYLPDAGGGYLIATNGKHGAQPGWDDADDAENEEMVDAQREAGMPDFTHMIFRYTVDADRIAVYQVDPLRMARLILAGKAPGQVSHNDDDETIVSTERLRAVLAKARAKHDDPRIQTYTPGPPAGVDALLAAHKNLFFAKPAGILRRAKASAETPADPSAKPSSKR